MIASECRIGNIVALCDGQVPDTISAIEPGMIHLSGRHLPDDERDIEGVFFTIEKLEEWGEITDKKLTITIDRKKILFSIRKLGRRCVIFFCKDEFSPSLQLNYIHELQNLVFALTGKEL